VAVDHLGTSSPACKDLSAGLLLTSVKKVKAAFNNEILSRWILGAATDILTKRNGNQVNL
jgi:hypothetical protein